VQWSNQKFASPDDSLYVYFSRKRDLYQMQVDIVLTWPTDQLTTKSSGRNVFNLLLKLLPNIVC
jgi:hypothetical protein